MPKIIIIYYKKSDKFQENNKNEREIFENRNFFP